MQILHGTFRYLCVLCRRAGRRDGHIFGMCLFFCFDQKNKGNENGNFYFKVSLLQR